MPDESQSSRFEPRWPVALTVGTVVILLSLLPKYIRLMPTWTTYAFGVAVLMPVAIVGLTSAGARWLRIERITILLFFVAMTVLIPANLANLLHAMVNRTAEITGVQLLASGIAVWISVILIFSLLFWQLDRGGPEARVNRTGSRTDWLFPQESAPHEDVPAGWRPTFVDYLYLAYSTATAFSTTDVMPLTGRAKLLMMFESLISLATILLVAARAVNILGG